MKKIYRFIQIDMQYMIVSRPLIEKVINIINTNLKIIKNLTFSKKKFKSLKFNGQNVIYDTPFATKTFLAAIYDFYHESQKGRIFTSKNPIIIDIGANIGQFLYATKTFYPGAEIHSVEPDSRIFKLLRQNSKSLNSIFLYNYALSNVNKKMKFYVSDDFSEWSGLKKIKGKKYHEILVEAKKGDEIFQKIKKIDLLKIDVEGSELDVIKGMNGTLKKSKYVLIELSLDRNSSDLGSSRVIQEMLNNNFYIFHIGRIFSPGVGEQQGAVDVLFKNKV